MVMRFYGNDEIKCYISDSGLIIGGSSDVILADFAEKFRQTGINSKSVEYISEEGIIRVKINYNQYDIKLSDRQKIKFESNVNDPISNCLRKLIAGYEKDKLLYDVRRKVQEGELPTEAKAINVYSDSLDKELVKTGTEIAKDSFHVLWPLILIGLTIPAWTDPTFGAEWSETVQYLVAFLILGGDFVALCGVVLKLLNFDDLFRDIRGIKNLFKEVKRTLLRKKDLKTHVEGLNLELNEESFDEFIQKEQEKDSNKAAEYSDNFLQQVSEVLELVKQLPENEQEPYCNEIINIIGLYRKSRINTLEGDSPVLIWDESRGVKVLSDNMMPTLIRMRSDIETKLRKYAEIKRINEQCDTLEQSVPVQEITYKDGWTDDLDAPDAQCLGKGI